MSRMNNSKEQAQHRRDNLPPWREEDRGVCLTQLEIAQRLGISRARVGQLEKSAMRKLAAAAAARGIKLEDILG